MKQDYGRGAGRDMYAQIDFDQRGSGDAWGDAWGDAGPAGPGGPRRGGRRGPEGRARRGGFPGGPGGPGDSGPRGHGPRGGHGGPGGRGRGGRRGSRGDVRGAVLTLLAEQPMHGYQLIQEIAERSGGSGSRAPAPSTRR
ncbi:hypothetical protein GCM10025865_19810 [Paraoerskovia sediminicola]|uniref:PadR family transcriptional regulator n=1 Tax=Paraoerskovia sediminicola TaxID=1138587 RepID=A0ABM8G3K8_9CELL|nr:hypothetical protein GCM10025865_19810 [Paraoerskovia sediminicola]